MKVFFATSNANKVPGVAKALEPFGLEVVQLNIELPELQADRAEAVASEKAKWAAKLGGQWPVFVIDSAFHIDALKGFPGTNVKHVTKQIGLEGYLRLMSHLPRPYDRTCFFLDALACVAAPNDPPMLYCRGEPGTLAEEPLGPDKPEAKSPLWRLFFPSGQPKTLAEMSHDELWAYRATVKVFYEDFARGLLERLKPVPRRNCRPAKK